ncbi:MAG: hypothetical protein HYX28_11335 [Candidatus Koribacter versatilis]|uniref:Tetratricopeptide repeat protein n=1 Tax=Candidatus Korobacter versatilis TaxID=658062 RepID=A0A932EQM1_9BACT|nr:hypothetical protein [Candidatus Koribacter versatilis]
MQATRIAIAVFAATLAAFSQTPAAPASQAPASQAPANQAPANPPAKPAPPPGQTQSAPFPFTSQTAATPPTQPAGTKRPPQAKTQEEITAYNAIRGMRNGQQAEEAAKDFETKFPQSELRALVYQNLMDSYQASNSADKAIELGRKSIALDADNPVVLIVLANVVAERTRENDLERDQRYAEATKYAQHGLETIATNVVVSPGTTPEKVAQFKQLLTAMAHSALGFVELNRHNDANAERELRLAAQLNTVQPDPMVFLRLAIALDHQNKYAEALTAANRVLELSPNGALADLAHREKDRLEKLLGAGAPATPMTTAPGPTGPTTPATSTPPPPGAQPNPPPQENPKH